jgi:hypothetical protein
MEDSPDERLANLRNIVNQYSDDDKQYIADKLSDIINSNYPNVDFALSYSDLNTDTSIKLYLKDDVYKNILNVISDLKEYRALETALYKNQHNYLPPSTPVDNVITNTFDINAPFNIAFTNQLAKNRLDRMMIEEKKLAYLMNNDPVNIDNPYKVKLFHTLSVSEIIDNLALSIVTLFQQIYTLDYVGLMNSQDNFIYYGFIFLFSYVILSLFWNQLEAP